MAFDLFQPRLKSFWDKKFIQNIQYLKMQGHFWYVKQNLYIHH